jgi:hypothetical protein
LFNHFTFVIQTNLLNFQQIFGNKSYLSKQLLITNIDAHWLSLSVSKSLFFSFSFHLVIKSIMSTIAIPISVTSDSHVLIKVRGRRFEIIDIVKQQLIEPNYLFIIVLRIYGYNNTMTVSSTCLCSTSLPFISFQRMSRRDQLINSPVTLESITPTSILQRVID